MAGIGRQMPFTMIAFLIGSLSIIGLPPFGGAWSKWYLALGAVSADQLIFVGVLMVSSLLNIAYLIPIVVRAFFNPPTPPATSAGAGAGAGAIHDHGDGLHEAPFFCVMPLCLTALGCIVLFFFAGDLYRLLLPLTGQH